MFNDDDVISTYSDEQAVEDGVLVDIKELGLNFNGTLIDRMTNTVYVHLLNMANEIENKLAFIQQTITERLITAHDPDGDGYLIVIPQKGREEKLWLIRNERDNYTLMFPEDY
jgi:hypothetical protein